MSNVHGKVVIVTGAARGIGAAIADRMVNDGHAVALLDTDEAACKIAAARLRRSGQTLFVSGGPA